MCTIFLEFEITQNIVEFFYEILNHYLEYENFYFGKNYNVINVVDNASCSKLKQTKLHKMKRRIFSYLHFHVFYLKCWK